VPPPILNHSRSRQAARPVPPRARPGDRRRRADHRDRAHPLQDRAQLRVGIGGRFQTAHARVPEKLAAVIFTPPRMWLSTRLCGSAGVPDEPTGCPNLRPIMYSGSPRELQMTKLLEQAIRRSANSRSPIKTARRNCCWSLRRGRPRGKRWTTRREMRCARNWRTAHLQRLAAPRQLARSGVWIGGDESWTQVGRLDDPY
jgi:hypothetical protein